MEHIRLTDDKLLSELTFDKSDVFYWLTQQAKRGVASAQVIQFRFFDKYKKYFVLASFRCIIV
jgi:hypothetical protein